MSRLLAAVVLAAACGGRAPAPTPPPAHGDTSGSGSAAPATGSNAPAIDDRPRWASTCTAMIDHVIDLDVAERPVDERPAPADLARVRDELRVQLLPSCRTLTQDQITCITAAPTKAAIQACTPAR